MAGARVGSCTRRASCMQVLTTALSLSLSLSLSRSLALFSPQVRASAPAQGARAACQQRECPAERARTLGGATAPRKAMRVDQGGAAGPPTLACPPTLAPPHPHLSPLALAMALLLLAPDTNPEDDEHLFVEEPTIAADTLILHVSLTLGGLSGIALMADEAAPPPTRPPPPPPPCCLDAPRAHAVLPPLSPSLSLSISLTAPCVQVRECLAAQLDAYREHMGDWVSETKTLDVVSEVAAQLIEAKLASGDVAEYRSAKRIVEEMLHQASERLAASPGCENLRMLLATCNRHLDDD